VRKPCHCLRIVFPFLDNRAAVFQSDHNTAREPVSAMDSSQTELNEGLDDDLPHHVHIVTNEDMVAFQEYQRLNPATGPDVFISPLGDESVNGYPVDRTPHQDGINEIRDVVQVLESASIPCCMVAEPALIYYGTGRIMMACRMFLSVYQVSNVQIYRIRLCASRPTK
jgi:hypothetical protein